DYPENWAEIARAVKDAADWKCVRCGHAHDPASGYTLTVHHLDLNPANCAWWNIPALCQRCHLQIQNKVVMRRQWMFEHSEWFKPYVAGYYAHRSGQPENKTYVLTHLDKLLALEKTWAAPCAQGAISGGDF
ncbi:MAG: HNH endonuclease, partial [Anaerolineales bacterium]|nr:HNH endonuclease [Anaerolineales bacterium]